MCHIMVYGSNYLRKYWQTIHFFAVNNMANMVIIPWWCYESWWPWQETWPPCRHHGMIMTVFLHYHGMIMARAWQGSHVFPTRDAWEKVNSKVWSYIGFNFKIFLFFSSQMHQLLCFFKRLSHICQSKSFEVFKFQHLPNQKLSNESDFHPRL